MSRDGLPPSSLHLHTPGPLLPAPHPFGDASLDGAGTQRRYSLDLPGSHSGDRPNHLIIDGGLATHLDGLDIIQLCQRGRHILVPGPVFSHSLSFPGLAR